MLRCDGPSTSKISSKFTTETAHFKIENEKGLHTRPSTELVKCASKFQCHIQLSLGDTTVNAKSILGILMLAAGKGETLTLVAEGVDAKEAVGEILKLASNKFYIHY